jgi:nucleoside-diphosphate-sugar epimerase
MDKVVVTGGLGFIGSHLVEMLLDKGIEVIIIDNKLSNVVEGVENASIIGKSLCDVDLYSSVGEVDAVFHLASILGPSGVLEYAGSLGYSIVKDTLKIRDFCIQSKAPLIDISTSEVYGHPGILKENSKKVFPGEYKVRTEYGAGKMLAEMSVVNRAAVYGDVDYHFIRPFNVTGPRQKPDGGFVLPRFAVAALTGQPITVYGAGSQRRAYTHVIDICEAILDIVFSDCRNEIWNIGNPENEMSILDTARLVVEVTKEKFPDKDPEITFVDPRDIHGKFFAEAVDKVPFIEKINTKIGWSPRFEAKQIVSDVLDYYADKINNGYHFNVMG